MTYFFVGGAARTGGTLLNSILCVDPATNPLLRETHHFRDIVWLYRRGKKTFEMMEQRHYFSSVEDLREHVAEFAGKFLQRTLEQNAPAQHLVLKSFPLTEMFPDLHELIPEARYLISVRDPRDVIASQIVVGQGLERVGRSNQFRRDACKLAREYLKTYSPNLVCSDIHFKAKVLFVKYESITQRPWRTIKRIQRFTDLSLKDYDPAGNWSRSRRDFKSEHENGDPFLTEHFGRGITSSRIGRYEEVLTREEVQIIDSECAGIYQIFGYPLVGKSLNVGNG